jgi:hypothetical protein
MIELVNKYGPKKWSTIAQHLPGRIGKQCRERYGHWVSTNYFISLECLLLAILFLLRLFILIILLD